MCKKVLLRIPGFLYQVTCHGYSYTRSLDILAPASSCNTLFCVRNWFLYQIGTSEDDRVNNQSASTDKTALPCGGLGGQFKLGVIDRVKLERFTKMTLERIGKVVLEAIAKVNLHQIKLERVAKLESDLRVEIENQNFEKCIIIRDEVRLQNIFIFFSKCSLSRFSSWT